MKLINALRAVVAGIIFLVGAPSALAVGDDFNDNSRNIALWGDDILVEGTNAVLSETNGHLEFSGSVSPSNDLVIVRPWIGSAMSYTQNWEAAVDLHVGDISLADSDGASMMLVVVDSADPTFGNRMVLSLDLDSYGSLVREFYLSTAAGGTEISVFPADAGVRTGELEGRVRVAFDASTKTLYGSYNGIPLGALDVDGPVANWGMTTTGTFMTVLGGNLWAGTNGLSHAGNEMFADNFEVRTGSNLSYLLTVNNGTGGGSFTNHANVSITAGTAPDGMEFDHWAGSTQYILSVTSASTTLTMPAHAVALAAAYKLIGESSGDDFNDNDKDESKWGGDVYFSTTNIVMQETNGRLEVLKSAGMDASGVFRPWIENTGSYTQDWEVATDIHLGNVSLDSGTWVNINLAVANQYDTGDNLSIALDLYGDEEDGDMVTNRGYEVNSSVNYTNLTAFPNDADVSTGDINGRVKIAFCASNKVLTASYNGLVLGQIDVDDSSSNWEMTTNSAFGVAIAGSVGGASVELASGDMYADNFETVDMTASPAGTYVLTVNNGSGGGSYTNHAVVEITADEPMAGKVFEHWAGATQYVASVTSATTTVTMPAQAITLTAAYKLIGTSSGDDFNDNNKDLAKWGDDVHLMSSNTSLIEVNSRLELQKTAGIDGHGVFRPWVESVGSYTQSWEAAVDLHLSDLSLSQNGEWVNITLVVINRADTNLLFGAPIGDSMDIALDLFRDGGTMYRGYEMTSRVDGNGLTNWPNYGYAPVSDLDGRVKLAFDAPNKFLTATYNGNVIGWIDVDDLSSDWNMADDDTFGIAIGGSTGTESIGVGAGDVYADNFAVIGMVGLSDDADSDGLPGWWEDMYFGDPTNANPSALCSNGVNTIRQAYIAGFDPTDPDAFFGITGHTRNLIQWNAVSGRVYNVYWTTNLLNGFQTLETNCTGGIITDTLHNAAGKCFYKIDVRLEE